MNFVHSTKTIFLPLDGINGFIYIALVEEYTNSMLFMNILADSYYHGDLVLFDLLFVTGQATTHNL